MSISIDGRTGTVYIDAIAAPEATARTGAELARGERWAPIVEVLTRFKGISTRPARLASPGPTARLSSARLRAKSEDGTQYRGHVSDALP